jgi:hypothetical protein
MDSFISRMEAQRRVLQTVNRKKWDKEELFGLSSKAIDRWVITNRVDPESRLVQLIKTTSEKLFFLANKSQETVSSEYKTMSHEISVLTKEIESETV